MNDTLARRPIPWCPARRRLRIQKALSQIWPSNWAPFCKTIRSLSLRFSRRFASARTRRFRPANSSFLPRGVAATRNDRRSVVSVARSANRWRTRPSTIRLMVGGFTRSASASSPIVLGPMNTRIESADSWAGPIPALTSSARTILSTRIDAPWTASATWKEILLDILYPPCSMYLAMLTISVAT